MSKPRTTRRTRIVVCLGIVILIGIFLGRGPIQRFGVSFVVMRTARPSDEAMKQMVYDSADPLRTLRELWETGRIAHRQFVIKFVHGRRHPMPGDARRWRRMPENEQFWQAVRPIVIEAAMDVDVEVQQTALRELRMRGDDVMLALAPRMMGDADPDTRYNWLMYAKYAGGRAYTPLFIERLRDADSLVASAAVTALRQWHGPEVGTRLTGEPDDEALPADEWEAWWSRNAVSFPMPRVDSPAKVHIESRHAGIEAPDFSLKDLSGRPVRLSDFRGRPVLLNFWASWCAPCVAEIPDLVALHERRGDELVILGVAEDLLTNTDGRPNDAIASSQKIEQARRKLIAFAESKAMKYPLALDVDGVVTGMYRASAMPTTVLIDAEGRIARRWVGPRTLEQFEKIIDARLSGRSSGGGERALED